MTWSTKESPDTKRNQGRASRNRPGKLPLDHHLLIGITETLAPGKIHYDHAQTPARFFLSLCVVQKPKAGWIPSIEDYRLSQNRSYVDVVSKRSTEDSPDTKRSVGVLEIKVQTTRKALFGLPSAHRGYGGICTRDRPRLMTFFISPAEGDS